MKKFVRYFFHIDHLIITIFGFLLLALFGVLVINLDFLNPVSRAMDNFSITDIFFEIENTDNPEECDIITLIDMTDLYDRGDIAELLMEVDECNPLCVGVDLIFEGVKDDSLGNSLLEETISNLQSPAVFANKLTDYRSSTNSFYGMVRSYLAEKCGLMEGYTNVTDDMMGSSIREFSTNRLYKELPVLSFPAKISELVDINNKNIENEDCLINYCNVDFRVIPHNQVANNRHLIEGCVVLVGAMNEERDMHNTPLGKMPGLKIQAYSLLTLLEHKQVHHIPTVISWIIAFILCYLLEVAIDVFYQLSKAHPCSVSLTFLKESNFVSVVLLFVLEVLVCWVIYLLFVNHNTMVEGGIILTVIILTCEARDLYMAFIKGLCAKYDNNFLNNSLMKENTP